MYFNVCYKDLLDNSGVVILVDVVLKLFVLILYVILENNDVICL